MVVVNELCFLFVCLLVSLCLLSSHSGGVGVGQLCLFVCVYLSSLSRGVG